jgi:hypothetical protein
MRKSMAVLAMCGAVGAFAMAPQRAEAQCRQRVVRTTYVNPVYVAPAVQPGFVVVNQPVFVPPVRRGVHFSAGFGGGNYVYVDGFRRSHHRFRAGCGTVRSFHHGRAFRRHRGFVRHHGFHGHRGDGFRFRGRRGVSLIGCGRVTRAPVGILSGGSARAEVRVSFGLTQSHAHHRAGLGLGGGAWFYASLPAGFADLAGGFLLGSGTVNTVPHSPQRMRLPRTASGTRSIERQLRLGHMIVTDATDMAAPRGVRCNGDLPRLMSSTEHRSGLIAGEQPAGICCVRSACGIAAAGIYRNRGWACGVAGDGWVRRIRGGVI